MHYVKQFNINGVDTKQVACIELQGKPNAATEGAVGVLGIDVTSPTHEVYKCVGVNGSVYTWELLSAGMSIVSATVTKEGAISTSFLYSDLLVPNGYLIKTGDLILDSEGYLYKIDSIRSDSCTATYSGTHIGSGTSGGKDYRLTVTKGKLQLVTENGNVVSETNYLLSDEDTIYRDPTTGEICAIGIKTVNGTVLRFFVGEQSVYDTLTNAQKQGLFAIITDDKTKEEIWNAINNSMSLQGGTSIPKNSDLNDYYEVGNYYVESVDTAPTVSNMPIETAGMLKVISGNGASKLDEWFCIIQIFIAHSTGDMYTRGMIYHYDEETSSYVYDWQPWEQISGKGAPIARALEYYQNELWLVDGNNKPLSKVTPPYATKAGSASIAGTATFLQNGGTNISVGDNGNSDFYHNLDSGTYIFRWREVSGGSVYTGIVSVLPNINGVISWRGISSNTQNYISVNDRGIFSTYQQGEDIYAKTIYNVQIQKII